MGLSPVAGRLCTPSARCYDYAWVLWLDQYADSECHHPEGDRRSDAEVELYGGTDTAFELLSLVPDVNVDTTVTGRTDANGYRAPAPGELDWAWTRDGGWAGAVLSLYAAFGAVRLRLAKTSDTSLAPVCVLTNASRGRFE